jgi:hypothetical protein
MSWASATCAGEVLDAAAFPAPFVALVSGFFDAAFVAVVVAVFFAGLVARGMRSSFRRRERG